MDSLPSFVPNSPSLPHINIKQLTDKHSKTKHSNIFGLPDFDSKPLSYWIKLSIIIMLKLVLTFIVAYLSWNCNQNMNIFLRIIVLIISIIFSEIYMIYYAVFRSLMGNKCF